MRRDPACLRRTRTDPMSRSEEGNSTTLPLWVALCSIAGGALLYFGNTVPALQEQSRLLGYGEDLTLQQQRLDATIRAARLAGVGGGRMEDIDLQSLFVAIDERGYTIAEFLAANPSVAPTAPVAGDPNPGTDAGGGDGDRRRGDPENRQR